MAKLYTKLAWFFLLLLLSLLLILHPRVRAVIRVSCYPGLALAMGLTALLALFKNQASHYVFPAAGFLAIFMGIVISAALSASPAMKRGAITILSIGIIAIPVSVFIYRPAAFQRFIKIKDFSSEQLVGDRIQALVGDEQHALLFNHMILYWTAHRYPNIPYIAHHVQFTHGLRNDPAMLNRALEEPSLVLVEYNPKYAGIRDPAFFEDPRLVEILGEFEKHLRFLFEPVDLGLPDYSFWIRKDRRG